MYCLPQDMPGNIDPRIPCDGGMFYPSPGVISHGPPPFGGEFFQPQPGSLPHQPRPDTSCTRKSSLTKVIPHLRARHELTSLKLKVSNQDLEHSPNHSQSETAPSESNTQNSDSMISRQPSVESLVGASFSDSDSENEDELNLNSSSIDGCTPSEDNDAVSKCRLLTKLVLSATKN